MRVALRIAAVILLMPATIFVAALAIGALGLAGLYVHSQIVPAKLGEAFFPQIATTVRLQFHYTWGDESGRFITVTTPNGTIRGGIEGSDWAHNARTCIYATQEWNVVIVGLQSDTVDHIANKKSLKLDPIWERGMLSASWKYLGAFDNGTPSLHFYAASDQPNCDWR